MAHITVVMVRGSLMCEAPASLTAASLDCMGQGIPRRSCSGVAMSLPVSHVDLLLVVNPGV